MDDLFDIGNIEMMLQEIGSKEHVQVRAVKTLAELRQVFRLTHDCYVESGYCARTPSGMLLHYGEFDPQPETTILVAIVGREVVGSISLTTDGGQAGLTTDHDFKDECDALRQQGQGMGSIWRLVVEKSSRSRLIVVSMMREMIQVLLREKVAHALMAVNPKHVSVYKRMLAAQVIGEKAVTDGLQEAPSTLLCFNPAQLPENCVLQPKPESSPLLSSVSSFIIGLKGDPA